MRAPNEVTKREKTNMATANTSGKGRSTVFSIKYIKDSAMYFATSTSKIIIKKLASINNDSSSGSSIWGKNKKWEWNKVKVNNMSFFLFL